MGNFLNKRLQFLKITKINIHTCFNLGSIVTFRVKMKYLHIGKQAMMALQEIAVLNGFNVASWC